MIMRETGVGGERGVNNRKVELRLVGGGGGGCNDDFRDRSDFADRVNINTNYTSVILLNSISWYSILY